MDLLRIPNETVGENLASVDDDVTIVVNSTDDVIVNDEVNNDLIVNDLTKEDLGLDENADDDLYDGLINDFRTKLDGLSFKRLNSNEIKAQAASFRAAKEKGRNNRAARAKVSKRLMLPAVNFQELEDNEAYRRDTGSSVSRSRASSGASNFGGKNRYTKRQNTKSMGRRKTVMGALKKRGRTMRKTLRALHINEADNQDADGYGSLPPTNEQRLRMFVLKEILDTETEYTKLLEFMVETMKPSVQKMADDPMRALTCKKETASQIFSNVKEIHSLHVEFHKSLQEALSPMPFHTHRIGKVFLQFKDKFSVYDEYCGNFSRAQKVCYEVEGDPDFQQLIEEWKASVESQKRRFLHLEGFIISPVQRLCKYPLFLKELKKYTPSHHKDYDDVTEAQEVMGGVTKSVNESERRQLMVQAIRDMETMCDSWEQSGLISKQGFLTKRGGSVKSWYIRWFLLREYQLAYYNEPTDLHPLGVLDLTSYKSLEADASQVGRPYAFGIKMPDRTYYMYTTTEQERQEWVNILQWKFDCIERSRRQAHRPFETVVFSSLSSFLHPKSQQPEPSTSDEESSSNLETGCDVINVGAILTPVGEDDDHVFVVSGESSNSDSPEKNSKSDSMSTPPVLSPVSNGTKTKQSVSDRRMVTSKIQKSPSRAKRLSSIFQPHKKSKTRLNSS